MRDWHRQDFIDRDEVERVCSGFQRFTPVGVEVYERERADGKIALFVRVEGGAQDLPFGTWLPIRSPSLGNCKKRL